MQIGLEKKKLLEQRKAKKKLICELCCIFFYKQDNLCLPTKNLINIAKDYFYTQRFWQSIKLSPTFLWDV